MSEQSEQKYYEFDGDQVTIPLLRPIEFDGLKVTSITLNEITVEESLELDKKAASRTALEQDIHYFAKMAGKPPALIQSMKERDWKRVKNAYWETLGNFELEPESSA